MDLSKLSLLSTKALQDMKGAIDKVLESRLDTRVLPGRIAKFTDSNGGVERTVRIGQLNRKSASCEEISPQAGRKWRVPPAMLRVEPIELKSPVTIAAAPKVNVPATQMADSW